MSVKIPGRSCENEFSINPQLSGISALCRPHIKSQPFQVPFDEEIKPNGYPTKDIVFPN